MVWYGCCRRRRRRRRRRHRSSTERRSTHSNFDALEEGIWREISGSVWRESPRVYSIDSTSLLDVTKSNINMNPKNLDD